MIFAPALKWLEREAKGSADARPAYYHAHWTRQTAPLLDELGAVIDHVDAFASGGSDELENLATACNKCNTRKSAEPVESWAVRPRRFVKGKYGEPTAWDGLSGVFVALASRAAETLAPGDRSWLRALRTGS